VEVRRVWEVQHEVCSMAYSFPSVLYSTTLHYTTLRYATLHSLSASNFSVFAKADIAVSVDPEPRRKCKAYEERLPGSQQSEERAYVSTFEYAFSKAINTVVRGMNFITSVFVCVCVCVCSE
jgi:hypothetical protein